MDLVFTTRTGKCKEEFEKWFSEEQVFDLGDIYNGFYGMGYNCQYGVYLDYFDSVGVDIEIYTTIHGFDFMIKTNIFRGYFETRAEARATAIEKANEIYNQ